MPVKSTIEGKDQAIGLPFAKTPTVPQTDVQRAIEQLQTNLETAVAALDLAAASLQILLQSGDETSKAMAQAAIDRVRRLEGQCAIRAQVFI